MPEAVHEAMKQAGLTSDDLYIWATADMSDEPIPPAEGSHFDSLCFGINVAGAKASLIAPSGVVPVEYQPTDSAEEIAAKIKTSLAGAQR